MAKKTTPPTKKNDKKEETDVILIVKGAGEQGEDDHLNLFLRGFWPAVKSLDNEATITQVTDELDDYNPSPHNEEGKTHKHLTEIRAKYNGVERRIWVKESYWEAETLPSSALSNLSREWQMTSHVFANMFQTIFFTQNTRDLKKLREKEINPKPGVAKGTQPRDYAANYISYLILFLLVFLPFFVRFLLPFLQPISTDSLPSVIVALVSDSELIGILLASAMAAAIFAFVPVMKSSIFLYTHPQKVNLSRLGWAVAIHIAIIFLLPYLAYTAILSSSLLLNGILLVIAVAAIWALAPSVEISTILNNRRSEENRKRETRPWLSKRLPGLPGWILILLIFMLILNPVGYIVFLLILLGLQITQLLSRWILWNYREHKTSDVDVAEYYPYEEKTPEGIEKRNGKVDEFWLKRIPFSPLLYRYFIFLMLPIGFVGTYLVKFLKWTRILGGVVEMLDKFVRTALVGYMDDVVNYAMDPAQAHRVRSAVKNDIIYFHHRKEVKRIHIVAHSQGTPITFEALFQFLEPEYQKKIYTYVTLGSILSYYHQARGILDPIYHNRFQVPIRGEKEYKFYNKSKDDKFRWMNFWNFTDPITEFYGLDEYTSFSEILPEKDDPNDKDQRSYTSPVNIRTHSSLLKNHGEYWDNIDQINLPFAKRVLGEPRPEEWSRQLETNSQKWHRWGVLILWILITVIAGILGYWLVTSGILHPLSRYFTEIRGNAKSIFNEYKSLFLPSKGSGQGLPEKTEQSLLQKIVELYTGDGAKNLWELILNGSFVILAVVALLDWLYQLRRAFNIWREGKSNKP